MINLNGAVNHILNEVDIVEYLTAYEGINFKKIGSNMRALCPLHGDTDPSFSITIGKNVYHCFGCKAGGSVINYVEEAHNLNRVQAIFTIFENLDLNIYDFIENTELTNSYNIIDRAVEYFIKNSVDQNYISYFEKKGFDLKDIKNNKIGYCDSELNLHKFLTGSGFSKDEIWNAGLYGTKFNKSIIFPIINGHGIIEYFQCRQFDGDSKYNTDSNDTIIVGIDKLKSSGNIILVEGYSDWLSLHLAGYNALCMRGLKLEENLINLLKSFEKRNVYVWVDGDIGGFNFIEKLTKEYKQLFCDNDLVCYVMYVEDKDPAEVVNKKLMDIENLMKTAEIAPVFFLKKKLDLIDIADYNIKYRFINYCKDVSKDYNFITKCNIIDFLHGSLSIDTIIIEDAFLDKSKKYFDLLLEREVISALLDDPSLINKFDINAELFSFKSTKYVCGCILNHNANRGNILSFVEGWTREFVEKLPISNLKFLSDKIELLRSYQKSRDMYETGRKIMMMSDSHDDCLEYINESLLSFYSNRSDNVVDFYDSMKQVLDDIVSGKKFTGYDISSRFPVMNSAIFGIVPSKLIILMGVTGHGKTIAALNIASILSCEQEYSGLYFCGEMEVDELTMRYMSINSGVSNTDMYTNNLDDNDMANLFDFAKNFSRGRLRFHGTMEFTKIVNIIKYVIIKYGLHYVVIDYLQLLEAPKHLKKKDRTYQLKGMTGILKTEICQKLNIPVIILGQLSDDAMDQGIPTCSKSSQSKLIQADADVTIAMRKKNKKELELDSNGNIIWHIDKVRYNRSNVVLSIQVDYNSLKMQEFNCAQQN